ncbi:MAG: DUF1573 domain-containing protein [Bacteroidota bacterium]|nr:DUF1573 domain-containing protein [Bacteroidota bacterium]
MTQSFTKRRIALSWAILLFSLSTISKAQAVIKFLDAKKNFGFVKQGKLVEITFEFTNTGNQPLIITDYKVECTCTSVGFPKSPVLPQQKGSLTVTFDTKTVYDRQDRVVEVISNAKNSPERIRFKGVVLKK